MSNRGPGTIVNSTTKPTKPKKNNKIIEEGFGNLFNDFQFNQSCMIVTLIFIICFMYKEEIMRHKLVKSLFK